MRVEVIGEVVTILDPADREPDIVLRIPPGMGPTTLRLHGAGIERRLNALLAAGTERKETAARLSEIARLREEAEEARQDGREAESMLDDRTKERDRVERRLEKAVELLRELGAQHEKARAFVAEEDRE